MSTTTTTTTAAAAVIAREGSALLPLEIRLRALEAQLGVPTQRARAARRDAKSEAEGEGDKSGRHVEAAADDGEDDATPEPMTRRVARLVAALEHAIEGNPALEQFYASYDRYAPLLRNDPAPPLEDIEAGAISERDLLPDSVKLAMVLEAADDIRSAERSLRELDLLQQRDVAGAGDLEEFVKLKPGLATGAERLLQRKIQLARARAEVASLVERYTEFTTTVSEMFLAVHERVLAMEERVARAERAKRKQLAEQY